MTKTSVSFSFYAEKGEYRWLFVGPYIVKFWPNFVSSLPWSHGVFRIVQISTGLTKWAVNQPQIYKMSIPNYILVRVTRDSGIPGTKKPFPSQECATTYVFTPRIPVISASTIEIGLNIYKNSSPHWFEDLSFKLGYYLILLYLPWSVTKLMLRYLTANGVYTLNREVKQMDCENVSILSRRIY